MHITGAWIRSGFKARVPDAVQLPQRRARAGESGAVGEETQLGQQPVEGVLRLLNVAPVVGFHERDVVGDAAEHLLDGLDGLTVRPAAQVATT